MSLRETDLLNIWEVAHRWEGVDPDADNPGGIPPNVQDRMRNLAQAVSEGMFCYDAQWQLLDMETRSHGVVRKSKLGKQLDEAVRDHAAHKEFLRTVFLHRYHVDSWYTGREVLPEFWFSPQSVEHSRKVLGAGN